MSRQDMTGKFVEVYFGQIYLEGTVVHQPVSTGDSWYLEDTDGNPFVVNNFDYMVPIIEEVEDDYDDPISPENL